jgi:hypothetical protein
LNKIAKNNNRILSALRVCSDFYDKLLAACKDAQTCPSNTDGSPQNCFADKNKCSNKWAGEQALFSDVFQRSVARVEGTNTCFGSAARLGPWLTAAVITAVVSLM